MKEWTKLDPYTKISGKLPNKLSVNILQNNLIRNFPVTPDDARRALKIYGPDIATLKGITVKKQNQAIPNYQAITILAPIITKYSNVHLIIDNFFQRKRILSHHLGMD